nr:MAG: polyprotein 1 [Picornavirales sp.]
MATTKDQTMSARALNHKLASMITRRALRKREVEREERFTDLVIPENRFELLVDHCTGPAMYHAPRPAKIVPVSKKVKKTKSTIPEDRNQLRSDTVMAQLNADYTVDEILDENVWLQYQLKNANLDLTVDVDCDEFEWYEKESKPRETSFESFEVPVEGLEVDLQFNQYMYVDRLESNSEVVHVNYGNRILLYKNATLTTSDLIKGPDYQIVKCDEPYDFLRVMIETRQPEGFLAERLETPRRRERMRMELEEAMDKYLVQGDIRFEMVCAIMKSTSTLKAIQCLCSDGLLIDWMNAYIADKERLRPTDMTGYRAEGSEKRIEIRDKRKAKAKKCIKVKTHHANERRTKITRQAKRDLKYLAEIGISENLSTLWNLPSKVDNIATRVTDTLDNIEAVVNNITKYFESNGISLVFDISILVFNLYSFAKSAIEGSYTAAIVALMTIAKTLQINATQWFAWVRDLLNTMVEPEERINAEGLEAIFSEQFMNALPTTHSLALTGGALFLSGFSLLLGGTKVAYGDVLKHFSEFGRAAVGVTQFNFFYDWLVKKAKDIFFQITQGKTYEQVELEKHYPQLEALTLQVELLRSLDFKDSYLQTNEQLCKLILELEHKLETIRLEAIRLKNDIVSRVVTNLINSIRSTCETARHSAAHCCKVRVAPAALWVYGTPGVGKTNLLRYLQAEILAKFYPNTDWNMHNCLYTRYVVNDYWDGYVNGTPIVMYDDICKKIESANNPNPELQEIICACNEAAWPLHMSAVKDKSNTFFDSRFLLATSNCERPEIKSLKEPDAFYRRFDMAIHVTVNPAYAKPLKPGSTELKIDRSKVAAKAAEKGAFNKDVYIIKPYDLATKLPKLTNGLPTEWTCDEFVDEFFKLAREQAESKQDLFTSMAEQAGLTIPKANPTESKEFTDKLIYAGKKGTMTGFKAEGDEEFEDAIDDDDFDTILNAILAPEYSVMERATNYLRCIVETSHANLFSMWEMIRYGFFDKHGTEIAAWWNQDEGEEEQGKTLKLHFEAYLKRFSESKKVTSVVKILATIGKGVKVKLNTFAQWIKDHLPTLETFFNVLPLMISTVCSGVLIHHFWNRSYCKMYNIVDFKAAKFCDCKCKVCKDFSSKAPFGTPTYGADVIKFLCLTFSEDKRLNWWITLYWNYDAEIADDKTIGNTRRRAQYIDEITAALGAESRETNTRFPSRRVKAESREVQTRFANHRVKAECAIYDMTRSDGELVAEIGDLVQLEQWESVTARNSVRVSTQSPSPSSMSAVFVTGRTILIPHHFLTFVKKNGGKFKVIPINQADAMELNIVDCFVRQCTDLSGQLVDLALVSLPVSIPSRPNIVNKFANANSFESIEENTAVVSGLRDVKGTTSLFNFHTADMVHVTEKVFYESTLGTHSVTSYVHYDIGTRPGDCGALIWTKSTRTPGRICGMHVAGKDGFGVGAAISCEFLQRNLDDHVKFHKLDSRFVVDARIPFKAEIRTELVHHTDALKSDSLSTVGNCLSLGYLNAPHSATKSQIQPSLIVGALAEPTTKPAHLRPFSSNGQVIDPMEKGIAKVLTISKPIDEKVLAIAVSDVADLHSSTGTKEVLTFVESIEGITDSEYITPINRTSSPGYPYCLDNGEPGKRKWFGYDEYVHSSEVEKDVNDLIARAANNQRGDVVWTATLKDERRPIAKVDAGKTRVFTAGPMHYTIAFRMYFLRFIENIMANKINNEIGVGTNVYSIDWHRTGLKITEKGDKVIAGDFSNFDGSLSATILWKILDMINDWYDDGPKNAQIRSVLFEEICNARVLARGELIQWDHSQPSGNPATVIINSIFNQIVMRYAYLACKRNAGLSLMNDFRNKVSFQTYGDDNLVNISDDVIEWYNQITITEELAKIGLTYTDEAKTGELVAYRTIDDIAYLKRKFVLNEHGFFMAPLDFSVCCDMPNWMKNAKGLEKKATFENAENAMREFFFHGIDAYDEARHLLTKALRQAKIFSHLPTFHEYESYFMENYY